jgi:hypothetical protein
VVSFPAIRIGGDSFLQDFLRMRKRAVMDVTRYLPSKSESRQRKVKAAFRTLEKQLADCDLTESVIQRHEKLFGTRPEVLAADKGFCPAEAKFQELAEQVDTLAIPRWMRDFVDKVLAHWQAFRAGIEGTISGLKRAFRLIRCFFRGFRSFSAAVGLGVFCHNLIVLAEHEPG